jgi:hypothetical protein
VTRREREKAGRRETRLRSTAYHEAGHAVASFFFGVGVRSIELTPDGPERLGCCRGFRRKSFEGIDAPSADDTRMNRDAIISLAGGEAEAVHRGWRDHIGAGSDYHTVTSVVQSVYGDGDTARKYLSYIEARTRDLIALPHVWRAVEAIAAALLRAPDHKLDGDEARALYFAAMSS